MSLIRSVARNTIIQVIGKILSTLIGLAGVSLLTRGLGQAGYGQYTTVLSVLGFISIIADLGLYLVMLRELACCKERPEEDIIGNVLGLRLAAAALLLVVGAALASLLPYPIAVRAGIWIGTVSYFAAACVQVLTGVFQVKMKMARAVTAEVGGRLVFLAATFFTLAHHGGLRLLIVSLAAGTLTNLGIMLIGLRGLTRLRLHYDARYWRALIRQTLPIAVSVVLNVIYFRIDTIFLSLFQSAQAVGLYGAAYKILEVLVIFPNMFVALVLPTLAAAAFKDWTRFRLVFQRAFDLLALAAFPLVVGGMFLARPLIVMISGTEFAPAAGVFRLLLLAVGSLYFASLSGHTIIAVQKQRTMVWGYLAVAIAGVAIYLLLIPAYSTTGAAIGTIVTETSIMLIGYAIILRFSDIHLQFQGLGKAALATAAMTAVLYLSQPLPWPVQLILAVLVYAAAVVAVRAVNIHEIRSIVGKKSEDAGQPSSAGTQVL